MTTTMRGLLRGAAAGAGILAVAWCATGCTGGDESAPGERTATAAEEQDSGSQDPAGDSAPSEDVPDSPFSDEELEAASQRFVDLLHVLDDRDWEAACDVVLDPATGTAPEGERLRQCVDGVEPRFDALTEQLDPGAFDAIDVSMIAASDNADGTVSLSVLGADLGIPMVPGDDGRWYLVIPF